ncbi:MAG: hypothetical protein GY884_30290 [Proteobacteria bacterium]|nr:hypothetical protein [Pseudomonadota bacterium]
MIDWINRLFSGGSAKGLSGTAESESLDDASFYAARMRKHSTQGDLVDDPYLLWSAGLKAHLIARAEEGLDFTDVLVLVNEADFSRTRSRVSEPWTDAVSRLLGQELEQWCTSNAVELPYPSRGVQLRVLADGAAELGGEDYGLQQGEFITGLLPNVYAGHGPRSRPVIAIHLNLPDVWEGYREVGRLNSDQVSFTLGNHWLDNFSHFTLQEPAIYRLQQFNDGNFVHIIDPDLRDRYSVVSNDEGGANVLSIRDENGDAVAHMVLALLDSMVPEVAEQPAATPDLTAGPAIELPSISPPKKATDSLISLGHGSKTIVPESVQDRIFTLRERGALLQKVHFRKFMQGYDVYVDKTGALSTTAKTPAATFQVRAKSVQLVVHDPTVKVDARQVALDKPIPLKGSTRLQIGPHELQYNALSGHAAHPGWPYLGEILRPASSTHMVFGGTYRVGRDRRCKVQLPDEPQNDNIAWLPSLEHGATIRARSGDIPKSRFYTDSIMVASEHAEIDLSAEPKLACVARHCFAYVRRDDQIHALVPSKQQGNREIDLRPGDDLLIGNCLFQVGFPPGDDAGHAPMAPPPAPPPKLTAESLAKVVSDTNEVPSLTDATRDEELRRAERVAARNERGPNLIDEILSRPGGKDKKDGRGSLDELLESRTDDRASGLDALLNTRSEDNSMSSNFDALLGDRGADVPAAGGLGEDGTEPPKPDLGPPVSYDSLLGDEPGPELVEGDDVDDLPEDSTDLPSILPRIDQIEAEEKMDDGGEVYGLPSPDSPRAGGEFDVIEGGADNGTDRVVPMKVLPQESLPPPKPVTPPVLPEAISEAIPEAPTEVRPSQPITPTADGEVVWIDDEDGGVELARPARLTLVGWALSGDAILGNHRGCAGVIPETRYDEGQVFQPTDYFKLKIRGRRVKVSSLSEDGRIHQGDDVVSEAKSLDGVRLEVQKRDDDGDEDFSVFITLDAETALPDPRAKLLLIDQSEAVVDAICVRGLPLGADHDVELGPIRATARFDGSAVTLSGYLDSYKTSKGRYRPFLVKTGTGRFRTAPEDGRDIALAPGDFLIAGAAAYRFEIV